MGRGHRHGKGTQGGCGDIEVKNDKGQVGVLGSVGLTTSKEHK